MQIEIPEWHEYGTEVREFLDESLSDLQRFKLDDRLEFLQKLTYAELKAKHKLEKVDGLLHELRVPIFAANIRLLGKVCGTVLYLLYAFPKKRDKLTRNQIEIGLARTVSFQCPP